MKSGPKSSDQVSDQVENESVVEKILEFCKKARTKKEISEYIGYKNLTYMTRQAIELGFKYLLLRKDVSDKELRTQIDHSGVRHH